MLISETILNSDRRRRGFFVIEHAGHYLLGLVRTVCPSLATSRMSYRHLSIRILVPSVKKDSHNASRVVINLDFTHIENDADIVSYGQMVSIKAMIQESFCNSKEIADITSACNNETDNQPIRTHKIGTRVGTNCRTIFGITSPRNTNP